MESNLKTQWFVGLFVVIGLFLVLISIFMLGGDRSVFKSYVHLKAHFDQVQGLNDGSVVSLSGINIGNIERIYFVEGTTQLEVLLRIEKSYLTQIGKGSQVEIRTQGALGDKYVFVIPGPAGSEPMQNGDTIDVAKATDIFNIISSRGKEADKIFDIIDNIQKMTVIMTAENRIDKMMHNFGDTSANLKEVSTQLKQLTANVGSQNTQSQLKDSVEKLDRILTKIDKGEGTLGALINDSSLHDQLKGLLGGSQRKEHIKSVIRTSIQRSADVPQ